MNLCPHLAKKSKIGPAVKRPKPPLPAARIWVLLASEASLAVIFRRGPSKWTRLYLWNTQTDEFTVGSWFSGQLYADFSDLSPDGEHLIYFARNESPARQQAARNKFGVDHFETWTALCKPPWVKAIGLWSVSGGMTGGGTFSGNRKVWLNNSGSKDNALIKAGGFTVMYQDNPNRPQQVPTLLTSMQRTGWRGIQPSLYAHVNSMLPLTIHKQTLELRLSESNFKVTKEYLWHRPQPALGRVGADWADVDQQGRLVYARAGKMYALTKGVEVELADLNLDQPPKQPMPRSNE